MYTSITLPYLFPSYDTNKFHKKLQNCKDGTILKPLSGLSGSLGLEAKPLAGVQGAEPPEAPRF